MANPKLEKTCWNCECVSYYSAQPHYSDFTPGAEAELCYIKGHWTVNFFDDSLREVRKKLLMAQTCKDYKEIERG